MNTTKLLGSETNQQECVLVLCIICQDKAIIRINFGRIFLIPGNRQTQLLIHHS